PQKVTGSGVASPASPDARRNGSGTSSTTRESQRKWYFLSLAKFAPLETLLVQSVPKLCCDGAGFQNVHDRGDGRIYLGIGVVEVRREADSCPGAPIHKNVAGQQLSAYLLGVGHINGDGAAALFGIAGSVDAPSLPVRQFNQASRLAF